MSLQKKSIFYKRGLRTEQFSQDLVAVSGELGFKPTAVSS